MKTGTSQLLKQIADEMNDLFIFLGEEGGYKFPKCKGEGFVVDSVASYDLRLKKIFFCEGNFLNSIRIYGVNDERFLRIFALYVLLHEFTHYALDILGLQSRLHGVPLYARFDEPFCEYIALRACVNGYLKLFGCRREIAVSEGERGFLPLISSIPRPAPYCYFKEIYARPENLLGMPSEIIFIRLTNTFLKVRSLMTNPDQNAIFRLLLFSQPIPPKKVCRWSLRRKVKAVGVVNVPL